MPTRLLLPLTPRDSTSSILSTLVLHAKLITKCQEFIVPYIYTYGKGFGDAMVNLPVPFGTIVIKDVMWVPDLAGYSNLLSVPQLTDHSYALLFDGPWAHILLKSTPIAMGLKRNRAYYLYMIEQPGFYYGIIHNAMLTGTTNIQPWEIWHKRLGHLN